MPTEALENLLRGLGEQVGNALPILVEMASRIGRLLGDVARETGLLDWISNLG